MSLPLAALALILTAASHGSAAESWVIFDPYPGARELCTQRVYGAPPRPMHFTWWAHASADAPDKVIAFYEAQHAPLKAAGTPWFSLRGPDRETLSVHAPAEAMGRSPRHASTAPRREPGLNTPPPPHWPE